MFFVSRQVVFREKTAIYERFIYRILYTELLKNTSPFMGYFSIQVLHNSIRDKLFLSHLVSISLIWDVVYSTFYFSLRINPSCVSTSSLLILLVVFCLQVTIRRFNSKAKTKQIFFIFLLSYSFDSHSVCIFSIINVGKML